jgi:deoxyribonucleoside regulator
MLEVYSFRLDIHMQIPLYPGASTMADSDLEEHFKLARIARLYYEPKPDGGPRTQEDVRVESGLTTQSDVSRALKRAEELGILKHVVDAYLADKELTSKLRQRFPHLREIVIAPYAGPSSSQAGLVRELGREAAAWFRQKVPDRSRIGVSCGTTISAVIDALDQAPRPPGLPALPGGCKVYALIMLAVSETTTVTPAALTANLVRKLPSSSGVAFQFPGPERGKSDKSNMSRFKDHQEVRNALKACQNLDTYLIGVGSIGGSTGVSGEFNFLVNDLSLGRELTTRGAVGESVHQPFNARGQTLRVPSLDDRVLFTDLKHVRKHVEDRGPVQVVAVAGGERKHDAVYSAVNAKYCNVLITDSGTAVHILKKADEETSRS